MTLYGFWVTFYVTGLGLLALTFCSFMWVVLGFGLVHGFPLVLLYGRMNVFPLFNIEVYMNYSNLSDAERSAVLLSLMSAYLEVTAALFRLFFQEIKNSSQEGSAPRPSE